MGHSADIQENSERAALIRELRRVLPNLYDSRQIRHSPLMELFDLAHRRDAPSALQHLLNEAIEALEPGEECPVGSNAWRVYQVLRGRYIDQFSQEEAARDMFLSPRQLRRLEQNAVEVLADYLWAAYDLELRTTVVIASSTGIEESGQPKDEPSGSNEEISWLERTLSSQVVECQEFVHSVLQIARPLIEALGTQVTVTVSGTLPALSVHLTTIRQSLLHVVTMAAQQAGSGSMAIHADILPNRLYVRLRISADLTSPTPPDMDGLEVARKLVQLSKGTLELVENREVGDSQGFLAIMILPTAEQIPILVIDDNTDTLSLVERYLSGTRYRFLGVAHPSEAIELAARTTPGVIILDVMLPEMDGWELLGRLRAHPSTQNTPIIICTILPQAQLALMLGAAEFLSKPIRREALLSALDRLVGPAWKESV